MAHFIITTRNIYRVRRIRKRRKRRSFLGNIKRAIRMLCR